MRKQQNTKTYRPKCLTQTGRARAIAEYQLNHGAPQFLHLAPLDRIYSRWKRSFRGPIASLTAARVSTTSRQVVGLAIFGTGYFWHGSVWYSIRCSRHVSFFGARRRAPKSCSSCQMLNQTCSTIFDSARWQQKSISS